MRIIVVGGGLSGLISATLLSRLNWDVTLIEKKNYPFHRVCGEYISNEVIPFLKSHGLYPDELSPVDIKEFQLTDTSGQEMKMKLDLGGFGISRYSFDYWLAGKAEESGVKMHPGTQVNSIRFFENQFEVTTSKEKLTADYVIGSFGKRSNLDRSLDRGFFKKKSPFIGVKYHLRNNDLRDDTISLHNFEGGYCGISRVENQLYNLCYLGERSLLKSHGSIKEMEAAILWKNPYLKAIFQNSDFVFDEPKVINEISFAPKEPVFDHILMSGDSAGMITPLCGNGMAMAIHGAKLVVDQLQKHRSSQSGRDALETEYSKIWKQTFQRRHWAGRQIQKGLFGTPFSSRLAVTLGRTSKPVSKWLMSKTHGQPFS
jgi:flavin-dependent dehydrogenase